MILDKKRKHFWPSREGWVGGGVTEEMILRLHFEGLVGLNPLWFESPCMNMSSFDSHNHAITQNKKDSISSTFER